MYISSLLQQTIVTLLVLGAVQCTTPSPPPSHSPTPAPPKLPCEDPVVTTKEGTYTYPLKSIQGKMMQYDDKASGGKIFLAVCADLPTGKPFCTNKDPAHTYAMAAYCPITSTALAISDWKEVTTKSWTPLSAKDPKTGVRLTLKTLSTVIKGGAAVEFICDAKSKAPVLKVVFKPSPLGFNFSVTTSAACPTFVPAPSGGWSTMFLIIFCLVLVSYCGGGCILNVKKHDKSMTQACPNRLFWCDLPYLVKDGCVCFFSCICNKNKTLTNGSNGSKAGGKNTNSSSAEYKAVVDEKIASTSQASSPSNYGTKGDKNEIKKSPYGSSSGDHNARNDDFADTVF